MDREMRLLFVEDSADDVAIECRQLEREKLPFEWRAVASAPALRQAIEEFQPDVVLSDFSMPGFSGIEALQIMKACAPTVPFIFVSGTIGEELAVQCLREGATDYVLKGNLKRLGPAVRRATIEAEEHARAREAEQARVRLAEILEATTDVVATTDPEGRMTYLNEAGCRLLGVSADEIVGRSAGVLYAPWAEDLIRVEAIPAAQKHGAWQGEAALVTRRGEEIPVSQVIVAHKGEDGKARFLSGIARDVRERKNFEARIYHLAHHDPLTGLPNRSLLGDRVTQAFVHAKRSGRSAVLLAINVDNFRLVNEGFGHTAGDLVLEEIGARLRAAVRDGDTVARTGTDEFVILLADLARPDDAHVVAHKVLDSLAPPLHIGKQALRVTASIGAAIYPADGEDFETLLRNAGAAMHRVKTQDRGGFQYYAAEMTQEALDRIEIESGLQVALQRGELALHYQPVYEIGSHRMLGVEALMRWFGPNGKPVSPDRFIPVAEETGLIRTLGEWALAEACSTILGWTRAGRPAVRVAVNVSPRQLNADGFIDAVDGVLRATGFPAELLELEITESALMGGGGAAIEALDQLKTLGVTIAIDDFGTGYSSLSYLSRMPIDRLKVDRSFVHRMTTDRHDEAIVRTVISLGRGLGLGVVAEGVETKEQLAMLAEMGCDEAQGYLFAAPASSERVQAMLM
jgi:diguanylate cyclase (GGDEF)-like protein/PAS domain S-box-containing protein